MPVAPAVRFPVAILVGSQADRRQQRTTAVRTIEIYDTTLRDGSQGEGVNFSLEDKLAITQRLDAAGIDYIEGGYPLSNPKDAHYFARARALKLRHSRICAFGMTRRRGMAACDDPGMRALVDAGTSVVTIVGKTSAFHVAEVLGVSREENLAMIGDTVRFLVESDREVFYDAEHFFDGWKLDRDYSAETILAAARAGASRIVLCDTNGGTLPEEVARIVREAIVALENGGCAVPVAIHCHNDCEVAVANSLSAVAAGAVQVQGTINGIGERCGNADLISVVANLALKLPGYVVLAGGGPGGDQPGRSGTAAKVRVSIESTDGEAVWGTVGVSENVIEASWLALADSFHHFLGRSARG